MNKLITTLVVTSTIVVGAAVILLKPIVMNENEYRVVFANTSEHNITSVSIIGAGEHSGQVGPIKPGHIRHFIFTPKENGILEYVIIQHNQVFTGVINNDLHAGDTGEIFVVLGEMHKVKIYDEFDI